MAVGGKEVLALGVVFALAMSSRTAKAKGKKKKKPGGNYRLAVVGGPSCLTCDFYHPADGGDGQWGECSVWKLAVEAEYVCDKWEAYQEDEVLDEPPGGCGMYPWLPDAVDADTLAVVDEGVTALEPELVALEVAYTVYSLTPEGDEAVWPPEAGDSRGTCIWDKILIRVNLILAELADDEINGDDDDDDNAEAGEGGLPLATPDDDDLDWPPYPEPGPVNMALWENPDNYPTPNRFHQIWYDGGDKAQYPEGHPGRNSVQTMKHLAQKALYAFAYTVTGDLDLAKAAGDNPDMWRAYRQIIDCSPWNQALLSARFEPPHSYDTPTGLQTALIPAHAKIREALAMGVTPHRRVDENDPKMISGGAQPYIWLPPLDPEAFLQGVIQIDPEYWDSGDSKLMPPPEVTVLSVAAVAPDRMWGCDDTRNFGQEMAIGP